MMLFLISLFYLDASLATAFPIPDIVKKLQPSGSGAVNQGSVVIPLVMIRIMTRQVQMVARLLLDLPLRQGILQVVHGKTSDFSKQQNQLVIWAKLTEVTDGEDTVPEEAVNARDDDGSSNQTQEEEEEEEEEGTIIDNAQDEAQSQVGAVEQVQQEYEEELGEDSEDVPFQVTRLKSKFRFSFMCTLKLTSR
ncbi:hypothetical protein M422DRAFT_263561 [Sphaerobolus stellatus SS14]|uniref:Uncharacterized protein n=1 Tax=Sphaerobolus stellatus (strain SS14) TaxID=990650 RepID=A0A0C9TVT7_SPHS4|nr:hypothetical protein M422DRAFT_263561 [Sphaerobolus stellatus SS14]